MSHIIAPGRSIKLDKTVYPAGADAPNLSAADLAQFVADGTLIEEKPAPPKPKPQPQVKAKPE